MSSVGKIYRTYTGVDPAGPEEENEVPALESSDGVLAWARTEPEEATEPKDEAAESLEDGED